MMALMNRLVACVLAVTIDLDSPGGSRRPGNTITPAAAPSAPSAANDRQSLRVPHRQLRRPQAIPGLATINLQGATISVFQPQVDSWAGNQLKAYAAVRVKTATKQDTDYGVIWFTARTEVDKVNRMVTLEQFRADQAELPYPCQQRLCLCELPSSGSALDQDHSARHARDVAGRDQCRRMRRRNISLPNDPPRIIFSMTPGCAGVDRRRSGAAAFCRQSAEGHQHPRADPV